jgi:hypothetical protein
MFDVISTVSLAQISEWADANKDIQHAIDLRTLFLCSYDVGKKLYSGRNKKQKAQNEIAEKLSTIATTILLSIYTKLGQELHG